MPKSLPAKCRRCGAKRRDGAPISRRGLCASCAQAAMAAAIAAQNELFARSRAECAPCD